MQPDNRSMATKQFIRWINLFIAGYSVEAKDSPRKNGFVKA
jgi:hypothetical protein